MDYRYGLDREIVSPITMNDVALTEEIAKHGEQRNAGKLINDRRAKADVRCNQMRWDGQVCDWHKMVGDRLSRIKSTAKRALYLHLTKEHASQGEEWLRTRMAVTHVNMRDFTKL